MPLVLHDSGDFMGRFKADHGADQVQTGIKAGGDTSRGDDAQAAEGEAHAPGIALAPGVALLPGVAALSGVAGTAVPTSTDVWVLIFVAEIKTRVVNHVAFFHHIGALRHVALLNVGQEVLKFEVVIRVSSGALASEDTDVGEQESSGADGEECALAGGVLLLKVGKGLDDGEGAALVLDDSIIVTAGNDNDVNVREHLHSLLVVDMGVKGSSLARDSLLLGADKDWLECLFLCAMVSANGYSKSCSHVLD